MNQIFKPKSFIVLKQGYNLKIFQKDLYAGIIVGMISIPMVIAFAVASGVSPEKGLISAIAGGIAISLFGGSRFQIAGPTAALIFIVYGIISRFGFEGLVISTIMAGIMLIVFGLLRLGSVIKLIPHPLIVGYTSGIALLIFTYALKDAAGFKIDRLPVSFSQTWILFFKAFTTINIYSVIITLSTILLTILGDRIFRKIPGYLVAFVIVTGLTAILNLPVYTIESYYRDFSGIWNFKITLPGLSQAGEYIQPALSIAILVSIQSLLSAVVADGMTSSSHRPNTELIGQGVANIISPCFGGIPVSGGVVRTVFNIKNEARTPFAGIIHSIIILFFMLVALSLIRFIPLACVSGFLIVFAWNLSNVRSFFSIMKGSRYDVLILLAAFLLTVFVNLTTAIEVGMVLAAFLFMQRISKMSNIETVDIDTDIFENYSSLPKGVDVYEISGPFFFGAAQSYKETLFKIGGKAKILILRMRHVPFIDSTGLLIFREIIRYFAVKKIRIILSGVRPEVLEELEKHGLSDLIGREYICDNFSEAVNRATEELNGKIYRKIF